MENPIKLMIVDDSRLIRQTIFDLLKRHFNDQAIQIEMADDGDVALALYERMKPDIMLLDIMMPRMSGIEVLEALQKATAKGEVQVIMITGMDDDHILSKCFSLDAKDFIRKPIHDVELMSRLEGAIRVHRLIESLNRVNQELLQAKNQMVQAEKMAAVGQLAAGIAHEINNPVGFIASNINTLKSYYNLWKSGDKDKFSRVESDVPDLFEDLAIGIVRIKEIVDSLRSFARIDNTSSVERFDVEQGIRDTLIVARHRYRYIANVETDYGGVPHIQANGGKINQVLMNLIINAADAIKSAQAIDGREGMIVITTEHLETQNAVRISVKDNGQGMSSDVLQEVFNPFFTTKPVGSGTGLGLSMSYDIIVNEHKGSINAKSVPGEGSEFTMLLPVTRQGEA